MFKIYSFHNKAIRDNSDFKFKYDHKQIKISALKHENKLNNYCNKVAINLLNEIRNLNIVRKKNTDRD